MVPVMMVHGGASGTVVKRKPDEARSGVKAAVRAGHTVLKDGGTALDAVVEAVTRMEQNPTFSAGRGSVLNVKGEVEMDAIVMEGSSLSFGAVSAVRTVAHPVQLARLIMERSPHVCLTAEGASQFARAMGMKEVTQDFLVMDHRTTEWRELLKDRNGNGMGTVGAVALDAEGNVACATSTGGTRLKMEGRVGDSATVGCGAYADNEIGAVSATGNGEANMKVTLAKTILVNMEKGLCPQAAVEKALSFMHDRVGGLGGALVLNPEGVWAVSFTSYHLPWAVIKQDALYHGLYPAEHYTQNVDDHN